MKIRIAITLALEAWFDARSFGRFLIIDTDHLVQRIPDDGDFAKRSVEA